MVITCTKILRFCAGHRVMGHGGKCANMHGHNYRAEIMAIVDEDALYASGNKGEPQPLDSLGRVVDFSVIKDCVGGWIDLNWDHAFIYAKHDDSTKAALNAFAKATVTVDQQVGRFELTTNPTAENMAAYLLEKVCPDVLDRGYAIKVVRVRLWETDTCYADACLDF